MPCEVERGCKRLDLRACGASLDDASARASIRSERFDLGPMLRAGLRLRLLHPERFPSSEILLQRDSPISVGPITNPRIE